MTDTYDIGMNQTSTENKTTKDLCQICKNGMSCEKMIAHAGKFWNTTGGRK